ncbi:MAG: hypothetical protein IJT42_05085, partial [Treponema sp.]|nr:hypothetical protein [Treponema sp.]
MLAVMGACAWGAWADEEWSGTYTEKKISTTDTIILTDDTTITSLWIYTENSGATIDLNGHSLTVTNFYLGGEENEGKDVAKYGLSTTNAILNLTDSSSTPGTLLIKAFLDVANDKNTQLILANGVSVKVTGSYWLNADSGKGITVSGDGIFDVSDGTNATVTAGWISAEDKVYASDVVDSGSSVSVVDPSDPTSPTTGVETDTYYWTGNANDGNVWTTSGNWAANTAGTAVKEGTYPGHADGEKAIFSVSATVENLTVVANAGLSVIGDFIISGTTSIGENSSLTFNGKVTNNGSIDCSNATVTFNGDYSAGSASIFTASTGNTIFYGNADFSEMSSTNFTEPVAGKIYFITNGKTLTTCTGQSFITLYLGGTSTLDIGSGGAGGTNILMHTDSSVVPYLTSASVVIITGSGKLTCTTNLEIDRISSTGGVTGTLKIDCDVDTPVLYTHSGTNLVVNAGKTLTITSTFTDNSSSTDKNSFTINGILDASGVSSLSFSGYSSLVVNEGGTLTANSISNTTKITNSGTIQTASLTANVLESGTTSAPLGTLEITG